ncbi:hypothetical protein DMNBHIDG_02255 [Candidatus Methanoperedenaceae archaeon GB37]|nr:hypothetical protein DMNBHIDG_02255 [Candidatus Methanoperedenaceae archaeon GB37]
MKSLVLLVTFLFLFCGISSAGVLYGRIIQENGRSFSKNKDCY